MALLAGLLAGGVIVILLAVLAWRRTSQSRRATMRNGVTEQQARENAAPLTTAILSGSRNCASSTRNNEQVHTRSFPPGGFVA